MQTATRIPTLLSAPAPQWFKDVDVVVLGSGAAGLSTALAVRPVRSVLVVTKDELAAGSTAWAQGGLAAVLHPEDSIEQHVADTLAAGAGLCDEGVVTDLATEAPTAIRYLMRLGAAFDPGEGDAVALGLEGGHSHQRIVHSGGDRSGAEVQRTLDISAVRAGVEVMEHTFAIDLVVGHRRDGTPQAAGVLVAHCDPSGAIVSVGLITARAVVLASGGYGQVFASTSNPPAVTGDGLSMAMRAGVVVSDLEFMQFHPTVLWTGPGAHGQQALISEAVRGEGAVLVDADGRRFMPEEHPLGDLAPRDVVAAAIERSIAGHPGTDHVWLDATGIGERFHQRFPSITAACRAVGIDPAIDPIPVAPASHYACGGVRATLDGVTSLAGLFAVGEVTCTGVHGANRLASNSLTESVVAGTRLGRDLAWELPDEVAPMLVDAGAGLLIDPAALGEIRGAMSRGASVMRSEESLHRVALVVDAALDGSSATFEPTRASWEATNLVTVASALVTAARARTESRGCHRRTDWPATVPEWRVHLDIALSDPERRLSGALCALDVTRR